MNWLLVIIFYQNLILFNKSSEAKAQKSLQMSLKTESDCFFMKLTKILRYSITEFRISNTLDSLYFFFYNSIFVKCNWLSYLKMILFLHKSKVSWKEKMFKYSSMQFEMDTMTFNSKYWKIISIKHRQRITMKSWCFGFAKKSWGVRLKA